VDAAFDSLGTLWAFLYDSKVGTPDQGLYKIDVGQLSLSRMTGAFPFYYGIAFGPDCPATTYCSPKTSSRGCLPSISAQGLASTSATSGFEVTCSGVPNGTNGMLVYGFRGPAAKPFGGGTLCVAPRVRRTVVVSSGGSAPPVRDCTGSWTIDLNRFLSTKTPKPAGTLVNCQWIGRDPGFPPPGNWSLSDALEFRLCP
jgi:hypothetical protein